MRRTIRCIAIAIAALAIGTPVATARPALEPAQGTSAPSHLPGSHVSPGGLHRVDGPQQFDPAQYPTNVTPVTSETPKFDPAQYPTNVTPVTSETLKVATDDGSGPAPWLFAGAALALFAAGGIGLAARRKVLPHRPTGAHV
jgi:hypothetical protein